MATVMLCGWEAGPLTAANVTAGIEAGGANGAGSAVVTTPVHTGIYALRLNPSGVANCQNFFRPFDATGAQTTANFPETGWAQCYIYVSAYPSGNSQPIFAVSTIVEVRMDTNGAVKLHNLASESASAGTVSLNTWTRIRFKWARNATCELSVGGGTAVTHTGANNASGAFYCGATGGTSCTYSIYYDDLVIDDAAYPTDGRIVRLTPRGAGASSQWTGSYTDVDDTTHDSDTSYLTSSTSGQVTTVLADSFSTAGGLGTPLVVKTVAVARDEGGVSQLQVRLVSGATSDDTTSVNITTTYEALQKLYTVDPLDSTAWNVGRVNALEVGVENNANVAVRVTALSIMVFEDGAPVAPPAGPPDVSGLSDALYGGLGVEAVTAAAYVADGSGRILRALPEAIGNRTYRTGQPGQAIYTMPAVEETQELVELLDPREGRLLVISSPYYPLTWVGPIVNHRYSPASGEVTVEAQSYEAVLQRRLLPSSTSLAGAAGLVFEQLVVISEAVNSAAIMLSQNIPAGPVVAEVDFSDRTLFDALNMLARGIDADWWLEHETVNQQVATTIHFGERGVDRYDALTLNVGPWGNVDVRETRITADGAHVLRGVAGARSVTDGFSSRLRTERRYSSQSPIEQALVGQISRTVHGHDFSRAPTGGSVLTRAAQVQVLEAVRGEGDLAIATEALLRRPRVAERAVDLTLVDNLDSWQLCEPGDVLRLDLPKPYFIDGYAGPVRVVSTRPVEHLGTMQLVCELANA